MEAKEPVDPFESAEEPEGKFQKFIRIIEEIFFTLILMSMIFLGLAPIILRSFFESGISWAEPLSRHFVLWLALFGAGAATQDRKHITIDVISNFLPARWKMALRAFTGLLSAGLCGILLWISIKFVIDERQYAFESSVSPRIPEWVFEIILPVGFLLLTIRLLIAAVQDAYGAITNRWKHDPI